MTIKKKNLKRKFAEKVKVTIYPVKFSLAFFWIELKSIFSKKRKL